MEQSKIGRLIECEFKTGDIASTLLTVHVFDSFFWLLTHIFSLTPSSLSHIPGVILHCQVPLQSLFTVEDLFFIILSAIFIHHITLNSTQ